MSKINELNIRITKAVVTKVSVELDFESQKPTWVVEGKLLTNTGKPVSDFCFNTYGWNENSKIEVPLAANLSGRALFEIFTPVILEKLGETFKALPAPKKKKEVIKDEVPF